MASPDIESYRHNGTNGNATSRNKKGKSKIRNMVPFCCCEGDDVDAVVGRDEFQPPEARGCTDLIYLIIFVIFCFIMILIAGFAYVYGNPYRLINGMDSFGNICGTSNEVFGNLNFSGSSGIQLSGIDMTNKPYVFFFNLYSMETSTKICVERCPDRDLRNIQDLKRFYTDTGINLCRYDYTFEDITMSEEEKDPVLRLSTAKPAFTNVYCPNGTYTSLPILKRCVPKSSTKINHRLFFNIYNYLNGLNIFKKILGDLAITWITVIGLTAISFVTSFLLVILIHWITSFVAQMIMIASSLLSIGLTIFLWWTFMDLKQILESQPENERLEESYKNKAAFLTYSILATIFTVLLLLVTFVLRKRVAVVVQLFREAGSALLSMPCLVVQPFVTYFTLTGFFCAWLYVVLCLATSDIPTSRQLPASSVFGEVEGTTMANHDDQLTIVHNTSRTINPQHIADFKLIEYNDAAWVKYMWWIYIIGLVWCSEFILGCQQMVIASSVAAWYFSRNRPALKCVIMESIVRLLKYHVGSVALGSFIITVVKIPRLMLAFSDRVLRKWEDNWSWVKWLKKGCACCLTCFENCLKYIHHNAYTVIAIQGVDFCPASRLAFAALVQNALQVAVINSTGDFVLFLAKCITAAITGLIALFVFRSNESLYFYAIPVLLTVVFSYFVAHCVISVFEMAVDTLFLCFCEDHNMNDGTDGKEYYAPESLYKYMTVDAVDAVAPGRRANYSSSDNRNDLKAPIELSAIPEEAIPINSNNSSA